MMTNFEDVDRRNERTDEEKLKLIYKKRYKLVDQKYQQMNDSLKSKRKYMFNRGRLSNYGSMKFNKYKWWFGTELLHGNRIDYEHLPTIYISDAPQIAGLRDVKTDDMLAGNVEAYYIWLEQNRNCKSIIMLTKYGELTNGGFHSAEYFPQAVGEVKDFDYFNVTCNSLAVLIDGDIEQRVLRIRFKGKEQFLVTHYYCTFWLQGLAPSRIEPIIYLGGIVLGSNNTFWIHSSNGTGRAPTFVYSLHLAQETAAGRNINHKRSLEKLREMRANSIENEIQYTSAFSSANMMVFRGHNPELTEPMRTNYQRMMNAHNGLFVEFYRTSENHASHTEESARGAGSIVDIVHNPNIGPPRPPIPHPQIRPQN
uniref:Tyrosine-protein phosphatase domain-containing protein n=2 Tax=Caenorhabditis tropicalis TaxID=1561998 RepID=A0A1I7UMM9_9PELO